MQVPGRRSESQHLVLRHSEGDMYCHAEHFMALTGHPMRREAQPRTCYPEPPRTACPETREGISSVGRARFIFVGAAAKHLLLPRGDPSLSLKMTPVRSTVAQY